MTILIVTDCYPPDRIGGVGAIARGLADAYRALGHRVIVLTTGTSRHEPDVVRGARRLGLGVLTNNVRALRIIRRERVDLVHLHQAGTTPFLLAARLMRKRPFILDSLQVSYLSEAREMRTHVVRGIEWRPTAREHVERLFLAPAHVLLDFIGFALSDAVTTVSRDNRDELLRTYGRVARRTVTVVPNGVGATTDTGQGLDDATLDARLRGRVVVGYLGVFRARKRVGNLIVAFGEIAARCPEAMLLVVGGGRGYDSPFRELAAKLGIGDRVLFTGSVPPGETHRYLSRMDIVCLLSSYEGMPMALLEAMQQGKAIVATNGFGMRDLLDDSDPAAGVLVPVDDIPATAHALASLIRDPERRQALGAAARRRVNERFRWDQVARQYLALVNGTGV